MSNSPSSSISQLITQANSLTHIITRRMLPHSVDRESHRAAKAGDISGSSLQRDAMRWSYSDSRVLSKSKNVQFHMIFRDDVTARSEITCWFPLWHVPCIPACCIHNVPARACVFRTCLFFFSFSFIGCASRITGISGISRLILVSYLLFAIHH